jgi:hypothetical protein
MTHKQQILFFVTNKQYKEAFYIAKDCCSEFTVQQRTAMRLIYQIMTGTTQSHTLSNIQIDAIEKDSINLLNQYVSKCQIQYIKRLEILLSKQSNMVDTSYNIAHGIKLKYKNSNISFGRVARTKDGKLHTLTHIIQLVDTELLWGPHSLIKLNFKFNTTDEAKTWWNKYIGAPLLNTKSPVYKELLIHEISR